MSYAYDWNPMPYRLDIRCPSCGQYAVFEFAEIVKIPLKKDVPFFEESDLFEYRMFKDSCGHKWHGAIYYANLHGNSTQKIRELPKGYKPEDWSHSEYSYWINGKDIGAFVCSSCQSRRPHNLDWPNDAYYCITHRGEMLWAFNRDSAVELRDYISSTDRKTANYKWASFLLHIPTIFKKQNARESVVKQLEKVLGDA